MWVLFYVLLFILQPLGKKAWSLNFQGFIDAITIRTMGAIYSNGIHSSNVTLKVEAIVKTACNLCSLLEGKNANRHKILCVSSQRKASHFSKLRYSSSIVANIFKKCFSKPELWKSFKNCFFFFAARSKFSKNNKNNNNKKNKCLTLTSRSNNKMILGS